MAFPQSSPLTGPPPAPEPASRKPAPPPMGGEVVSRSAPKEAPKPQRAIRGLSIDVADGGWIGRISEEFGGDGPPGPAPKDRILATPEDVHAFVDEALGVAAPPAPEMPPDTATVTASEPLPDEMMG